jgi:hypothetical protein
MARQRWHCHARIAALGAAVGQGEGGHDREAMGATASRCEAETTAAAQCRAKWEAAARDARTRLHNTTEHPRQGAGHNGATTLPQREVGRATWFRAGVAATIASRQPHGSGRHWTAKPQPSHSWPRLGCSQPRLGQWQVWPAR